MENTFQSRLQKSLKESGMSASELSAKSGISEANISNYLNGKYVAKQDKCYLLADALGVDPGWLMTGFEQTVIIQDSETFKKIILGMSPQDYYTVMQILEKTESEMKKRGDW